MKKIIIRFAAALAGSIAVFGVGAVGLAGASSINVSNTGPGSVVVITDGNSCEHSCGNSCDNQDCNKDKDSCCDRTCEKVVKVHHRWCWKWCGHSLRWCDSDVQV
jgi:hypothetical protein